MGGREESGLFDGLDTEGNALDIGKLSPHAQQHSQGLALAVKIQDILIDALNCLVYFANVPFPAALEVGDGSMDKCGKRYACA